MAQLRRGLRLALGPHRRLALARDDLQRDVEPRLLVARKPDRARAAAAQRAQRAIAVEDELGAGERRGGLSHARAEIGDRVGLSSPTRLGLPTSEHLRRRNRARVLRGAGDARGSRPPAPADQAAASGRAAPALSASSGSRGPREARRLRRARDRRRGRLRLLGRLVPGQEQARRVLLLHDRPSFDRAGLGSGRHGAADRARRSRS